MTGPIVAVLLLMVPTAGVADERPATTVAHWSKDSLVINVSDLLTPSQRDIVNSGFSTFTMLALDENDAENIERPPVWRIVCSVKYDTWEEKYQLVRVEPGPLQTMQAKDYKAWSNECLNYTINDTAALNRLAHGATIKGILQVRQSSPDEGVKIKNWLVKQQSGFMQGLYAHMLGDFQFKGFLRLRVTVPARPLANSRTPSARP